MPSLATIVERSAEDEIPTCDAIRKRAARTSSVIVRQRLWMCFGSEFHAHRFVGNAIFIEDVAEGSKAEFGVEAEGIGLGVELRLAKAAFMQVVDGRFHQSRTDRMSTRIGENGDPLDLGARLVDGPETKRADRTSLQPCQQVLGIIVQPVELERPRDILLNDEHRLAYGKGQLSLGTPVRTGDIGLSHDTLTPISPRTARQA